MNSHQRLIVLGGVLITLMLPSRLRAAPGDLDPNFGMGGKVTTIIGSGNNHANAVALQPDGKIVAVGYAFHSAADGGFTNDDFAVIRYDSYGDLDPTFNGTGIVSTPIGTFKDIATAVVVQADGKIIAAGGVYSGSVEGAFAVVRYNPNGTLDTSFGIDGKVTTAIGRLAVITAVAIDSVGRIVAAGYASLDGSAQMTVARYNADGSLDQTFGGTGIVSTAVGNNLVTEIGVAIQTDDKIVVAGGINQTRFVLLRLNVNGSLDPTFNGTGIVTTGGAANGNARAVAIQPDGKIVAAGYSHATGTFEDFAIVRYNADGSVDSSFGLGGIVSTSFGPSSDQISALRLQNDGMIVVAGMIQLQFGVARYDSDGNVDTSFGIGGAVTTNFGNVSQRALAVELQPDGKIVATGWTGLSTVSRVALARYFGDDSIAPNTRTTTPTGTLNPSPSSTPTDTMTPPATDTPTMSDTATISRTPTPTNTPSSTVTASTTASLPPHDSVVLPLKPVTVKVRGGAAIVTKRIKVKVQNADIIPEPEYQEHTIQLDALDGDCPDGTIAAPPDFDRRIPGAQNSIRLPGGRTARAIVTLNVKASDFTVFNRSAPNRCRLVFSVSSPGNSDPTSGNNTASMELNVFDANDTEQTTIHETFVNSLTPLKIVIGVGRSERSKASRTAIGNADLHPEPENPGHVITVTAFDGDCPIGTVGIADYLTGSPGQQNSAMVKGARTSSGTLPITATASKFAAASKRSPARCVATVTATGPEGDTDSTNNTTKLTIDVYDRNDF